MQLRSDKAIAMIKVRGLFCHLVHFIWIQIEPAFSETISALLALCEGNSTVPHNVQLREALSFLWSAPERMIEQQSGRR